MENIVVENRDIIMFGLQPWDIAIGSNFKNMALEISKKNRVLYINRPLDRISYLKNKNNPQIKARIEAVKKGGDPFVYVNENLIAFTPRIILESINFLPKGFLYNILNRSNNKKLAGEIKGAAQKLNFKDKIVLIDNDFFNAQYLKEYLNPDIFIYYIRDYLLSQNYFTKHGLKAEPLIMTKADAVLANSQYLATYAGKYNKKAVDIGQGCDVEDFLQMPSELPSDIKNIKSPVIGYCGSLTSTRLDISLLEFIARERPHWNIVLVGPEDEAFKNSLLHSFSNVHFLGSKDPSELPGYVHSFDVCINPQLLNQMTIGNYPRKVDEYFAAGKPVVATKTEAMKIFEKEAFLCVTNDDYLKFIGEAICQSGLPEKIESRKQLSRSHTWEESVKGLYKMINTLENE